MRGWPCFVFLGILGCASNSSPPSSSASSQGLAVPAECANDHRFVKMLGTFPGDAPAQSTKSTWFGKSVCQFTGSGTVDPFQPGSPSYCTAQGYELARFGPYLYCVWSHSGKGGQLLASILQEPNDPLPDQAAFPTQANPLDVLSSATNCTTDPRHVQILGKWRGVTLCHWSGGGVGDPVAQGGCPGPSYPYGRVKTFPYDFTDVPQSALVAVPAGTQFCVISGPFWDQRGTRAAIMEECS